MDSTVDSTGTNMGQYIQDSTMIFSDHTNNCSSQDYTTAVLGIYRFAVAHFPETWFFFQIWRELLVLRRDDFRTHKHLNIEHVTYNIKYQLLTKKTSAYNPRGTRRASQTLSVQVWPRQGQSSSDKAYSEDNGALNTVGLTKTIFSR